MLYGGSNGKKSACYVGDRDSASGLGRSPGEGNGNPLQYFCLENPDAQRSLVDCSPWGCKESDITEQLSMYTQKIQNQRIEATPDLII